jgi:hypothetical protein
MFLFFFHIFFVALDLFIENVSLFCSIYVLRTTLSKLILFIYGFAVVNEYICLTL